MTERVSLKKLLGYGSLIDKPTYERLLGYVLGGAKYVNVPDGTVSELERRKALRRQENRLSASVAKRNTRGRELEKEGKIKAAIRLYETNITLGYPAHHAYKRLMVLYHKAKDYENEKRVIMRALEVFGDCPEYMKRLEKLR